jgi:uncharacterized damage-inducible protein DinB
MTDSLTHLFLRELDRLSIEIKQYKNPETLWETSGQISNSAGHLTLHIVGNLQHFIGAELGNSGYKRDRENEFNGAPVSIEKLVSEIDAVKSTISNTLSSLSADILAGPFPGQIPYDLSVEGFLLHLYGHFNYHLGQINYHRRLLDQ